MEEYQSLARAERMAVDSRATETYWRSEAAREAAATEHRMRRRMSLQGKRRVLIALVSVGRMVRPQIEPRAPQKPRPTTW